MRVPTRLLLVALALACLQPVSWMRAAPSKATFDACRLLTRQEVSRVQVGQVVETKATSRAAGGFTISDCFFRVEPFEKSVSLEVTHSAERESSSRDPRLRWERMFHGEGESEEDRLGEKEGKEAHPRAVLGVGEEAFWIGNPASGALYVLKRNFYLRISVGGAGAEAAKIEKASQLARKALARL
jgi:hypothetical protein